MAGGNLIPSVVVPVNIGTPFKLDPVPIVPRIKVAWFPEPDLSVHCVPVQELPSYQPTISAVRMDRMAIGGGLGGGGLASPIGGGLGGGGLASPIGGGLAVGGDKGIPPKSSSLFQGILVNCSMHLRYPEAHLLFLV
jgi:hypothetical protein